MQWISFTGYSVALRQRRQAWRGGGFHFHTFLRIGQCISWNSNTPILSERTTITKDKAASMLAIQTLTKARFASFHLNGPLQIYVHCLNHWLILCECWRTSEGNHWQVLPSNLSAFAILQIRQWLLDFRHVARRRNSEKIPTWSMEEKVVNFYWTQLIRSLQAPQVQTPQLGFQKLFSMFIPVYRKYWFVRNDSENFTGDSLFITYSPRYENESKRKWVNYSQACICWVLEGGYKPRQSAFRSGSYHFTTFWWIAQKWNIHKLRLWILKIQLYFWSRNEGLHCSSCGQSSSSFLPIK